MALQGSSGAASGLKEKHATGSKEMQKTRDRFLAALSIPGSEKVEMIQLVVEPVKMSALLKTWFRGANLSIGLLETLREPTKHLHDAKFGLWVSKIGRGIKNHRTVV